MTRTKAEHPQNTPLSALSEYWDLPASQPFQLPAVILQTSEEPHLQPGEPEQSGGQTPSGWESARVTTGRAGVQTRQDSKEEQSGSPGCPWTKDSPSLSQCQLVTGKVEDDPLTRRAAPEIKWTYLCQTRHHQELTCWSLWLHFPNTSAHYQGLECSLPGSQVLSIKLLGK